MSNPEFVAMLLNFILWALVIPLKWPTFAAHCAGDWSDVEGPA